MTDKRTTFLPRQNRLLADHTGKFLEHQASSTLALKFWPKITRKFFLIWRSPGKERREWQVLRDLVNDKKLAIPSCLGGGTDVASKKAGLDIIVPGRKNDDGEDDASDEEDQVAIDDSLSDLSSDEEDIRAANEEALADGGSIPTREGAEEKPKRKKKKKVEDQPQIKLPEVFSTKKEWMDKRTAQIKRWYYNATSKSRKVAPKVTIDFKGLLSGAVGGRALTEAQMYSKLYYGSRIKREVDAEIAEKSMSRSERIAYTAKRMQKAYEEEDDSVKEEVRAEIAKAAREKEEALQLLQDMVESGGEKEQTPEEYAKIQGALSPIIRTFFDMLGPLSGYSFLVIGGGPKSENLNGAMGYVSYNRGWGDTRDDFTFNRWYDDFHERVVTPFGKYCHEVYPEEVRLQRAITIGESPNLSGDALKKSGRNLGRLQYGGEIPPNVEAQKPQPSTQIKAPSRRIPSPIRTSSATKGNNPKQTSRGKTEKKGRNVVSSDDEDTDDEETDPSDPSESDVPKRRRTNGKASKASKARSEVSSSDSEDDDDKCVTTPRMNRKAKASSKRGPKAKGGNRGRGSGKSKNRVQKAEIVYDESEEEVGEGKVHEKATKARTKPNRRRKPVSKAVVEGQGTGDDDDIAPKEKDVPKLSRQGRGKAKGRHVSAPRKGPSVDITGNVEAEGGSVKGPASGHASDSGVPSQENNTYMDDFDEESGLPLLPPLPSPMKRKLDSAIAEDEGRQKRRCQKTREEEWAVETKRFLLENMKGKLWEELVGAWFAFESYVGNRPIRVTEVNARPSELTRWLQSRKNSMPVALAPVIEDMEDYRARWMRWWSDLKGAGRSWWIRGYEGGRSKGGAIWRRHNPSRIGILQRGDGEGQRMEGGGGRTEGDLEARVSEPSRGGLPTVDISPISAHLRPWVGNTGILKLVAHTGGFLMPIVLQNKAFW